MMGQLRRGGLAMVFGLRVNAEDNGLIVQTEFPISEGGSYTHPVTGQRYAYTDNGPAWLCTGDIEPLGFSLYDPRNLMPIDSHDPDALELPTSDSAKISFPGDY